MCRSPQLVMQASMGPPHAASVAPPSPAHQCDSEYLHKWLMPRQSAAQQVQGSSIVVCRPQWDAQAAIKHTVKWRTEDYTTIRHHAKLGWVLATAPIRKGIHLWLLCVKFCCSWKHFSNDFGLDCIMATSPATC
eukprot:jgi/Ulvmu1/11957/UM082_0036.1